MNDTRTPRHIPRSVSPRGASPGPRPARLLPWPWPPSPGHPPPTPPRSRMLQIERFPACHTLRGGVSPRSAASVHGECPVLARPPQQIRRSDPTRRDAASPTRRAPPNLLIRRGRAAQEVRDGEKYKSESGEKTRGCRSIGHPPAPTPHHRSRMLPIERFPACRTPLGGVSPRFAASAHGEDPVSARPSSADKEI